MDNMSSEEKEGHDAYWSGQRANPYITSLCPYENFGKIAAWNRGFQSAASEPDDDDD